MYQLVYIIGISSSLLLFFFFAVRLLVLVVALCMRRFLKSRLASSWDRVLLVGLVNWWLKYT
jgi:hypothetical protein